VNMSTTNQHILCEMAATMLGVETCPEALWDRIAGVYILMAKVNPMACLETQTLALIVSEYQRDCGMNSGNGGA